MATNLDRLRSIQVSALFHENTFGTAKAVDSLIKVNAGVIPAQEIQTLTDQDHIGGTEEPTDQEVFARSLSFALAQTRVKPHTLAFVAAYGMGSCVTTTPAGATLTRKHTMTPVVDVTQPSFSMEAKYKAGIQKQFSGCFVDSFALTFKRAANRFVDLTAQIYGSGIITAGVAATSEVSEGGLNAADAAIWIDDTTYDGSTANDLNLTTSDLTGNPAAEGCDALSLNWGYKNNTNLDNAYCIGSGLYLGNNDRSARTQELTYVRLYQDESFMDGWAAQTAYAMQVRIKNALIEAGFYYGAQLTFPLLKIANRQLSEQGGRMVETLTLAVLQHATYGSAILDVFNKATGYATTQGA